MNQLTADEFALYEYWMPFRADPAGKMASIGIVDAPYIPPVCPESFMGLLQEQAHLWAQQMADGLWINDITNNTTGQTPAQTLTAAGFTGGAELFVSQGPAGTSVVDIVNAFILDPGEFTTPHRNGMLSQNNAFYQCGIGVASNARTGDVRVAIFMGEVLPSQQLFLVGKAPPGATVWAVNIDINTYTTCTALDVGFYSLPVVGPGRYLVSCGPETKRIGPIGQAYQQDLDGQPDGATLTDGEFVSYLYGAYLRRAADPVGWQYWTQLMKTGTSRDKVRIGILTSDEFRNNFVVGGDWIDAFFQAVLGRSIEPGERGWFDQFRAVADKAQQVIQSPDAQRGPQ